MLSRRWARVFYIFTYYAIIVGIGLSLLVTGYDLIQQTIALATGGGRYFYIFILVGAYVATGVFAGVIALTRLLTVRKALSDIPKRYMPIKKIDIPVPVHKLISTELTRSAIIRHSTLPTPSHKGLSPPTQPHLPSTSYTPILLHSAVLIMAKASRFNRTLVHRKHETLRQYVMRARDLGLWRDEVANEGLMVWLDKYESVRFGGMELTEGEFLATMKLVYFLLMDMKPPEHHQEYPESVISSSSSGFSSSSESMVSFGGDAGLLSRNASMRHTSMENDRSRADANVLRQMDSLLTSHRKSGDSASLSSMIDYGSILEDSIDREGRERRMRGGRLGEREGSIIYYDVE